MSILRFKVLMEDYPDVIRTIDIPSDKTFEDLHQAVLKSVDFDNTQLASFYVCNEDWEKKVEITLIDMSMDEGDMVPVMSETPLNNYIQHVGEKLIFEYDFVMLWRFLIEVEAIREPGDVKKGEVFPVVVYSEGEAPGQYDGQESLTGELTEEDVLFVEELKMRNQDMLLSADDDEEAWDKDEDVWDDIDGHDGHGRDGYREDEDF
jgi:hypothetical protein